ncbi:MAG: helix-turn-helix transcriptional regulator [Deltaproteobacteria bacterium]|nr:helix-turn-helix transcriptional regulator [Deltaproteobacteria bacterium]
MQAELAERAGVPKSTVGRIESGARVPSTLMVERLVQASGPNVSVSLSEGGVRDILIGGMAVEHRGHSAAFLGRRDSFPKPSTCEGLTGLVGCSTFFPCCGRPSSGPGLRLRRRLCSSHSAWLSRQPSRTILESLPTWLEQH